MRLICRTARQPYPLNFLSALIKGQGPPTPVCPIAIRRNQLLPDAPVPGALKNPLFPGARDFPGIYIMENTGVVYMSHNKLNNNKRIGRARARGGCPHLYMPECTRIPKTSVSNPGGLRPGNFLFWKKCTFPLTNPPGIAIIEGWSIQRPPKPSLITGNVSS